MSVVAPSAIRVPKRISPSPLLEAVAEIRFEPRTAPEAVFGIVYSLLAAEYPTIEKMPILQLPDELRESDPDLRFQAHYRLSNPILKMHVGPRNIALGTAIYGGWPEFSVKVFELFRTLEEQRLFGPISRIGLRYVNFFSGEYILPRTTVKIEMIGFSATDPFVIRTETHSANFVTTTMLTSNAIVGEPPKVNTGSLIDLDTFVLTPDLGTDRSSRIQEVLESAHSELKRRFFSLLTDEFVASLNPEYEQESQ